MKLALFGATGGAGRNTLQQALEQGHKVRALVRTPAKLTLEHPDLTVIQGDVLYPEIVAETVAGADAVVCSLGNTGGNPDNVVSLGTKNIIDAMQQHGVRRLVAVTSLGVGDSIDQVPFAFKMLMKTVLRKAMADKEEQEKYIKASDLDWTIVRPGGLTDDPKTGDYTVSTGREIGAGRISRADVADFILKVLNENSYIRQTPAVT